MINKCAIGVEVVISWFDILASYIPGQTEEKHDSLSLASL